MYYAVVGKEVVEPCPIRFNITKQQLIGEWYVVELAPGVSNYMVEVEKNMKGVYASYKMNIAEDDIDTTDNLYFQIKDVTIGTKKPSDNWSVIRKCENGSYCGNDDKMLFDGNGMLGVTEFICAPGTVVLEGEISGLDDEIVIKMVKLSSSPSKTPMDSRPKADPPVDKKNPELKLLEQIIEEN